jgi:hypothetical protein
MSKFMLLYRSPVSAADQMANATPEQAQAGMDAWMAWAGRVGDAMVDMGSPTNNAGSVGAAPTGTGFIGGYSILEAESLEELKALVEGHPHLQMGPDAGIDVLELLPMPGAS